MSAKSERLTFERVRPDISVGLTDKQLALRKRAGAYNIQPGGLTPSVAGIVFKNSATLFNLINIVLATAIIIVGHPRQALFLGVVVCNTLLGIVQELRAKRTLDRLSVLSQGQATVVRNGRRQSISRDEIVLDDIVVLTSGNQVCADSEVLSSSGLEVDESLLTGESDRIVKKTGDKLLSGSFVTGGHGCAVVTAVGIDNFANSLTAEAKKSRKRNSRLLRFLNMVISVLAVVILPLGLALFFRKHVGGAPMSESVLGAAAAMIGMIPEGLVLLTGISLTVGALSLARRKALVQSLPCIETLARADVLCLDKTGTITDGSMKFQEMRLNDGVGRAKAELAIAELMGHIGDTNATAAALTASFGGSRGWNATVVVTFTSQRKWCAASFDGIGSFVLGAPELLMPPSPLKDEADRLADEGLRILCLASSKHSLEGDGLPQALTCDAILVLSDHVRDDAKDTFRYFEREGVILKVISGDSAKTAAAVARTAGIAGEAVDMSKTGDDADYNALAERYTVFGRVSPQQKQRLIRALQANGHTACMTGDGVNDILAMREAHCSVAMIGGSDAARSACDFVLMTPDFKAMIGVLKEGRRVINNIERVSSLYLSKTIFSIILTLIYIGLPYAYPYAPLQMTPINALTVGIPSFFLALQANYARPDDRFLANVLQNALPAAVTVVASVILTELAGVLFGLEATSTTSVFLVGCVGFFLLDRISRPRRRSMNALLLFLTTAFALAFSGLGAFFTLESLWGTNLVFCIPMLFFSYFLFRFLCRLCNTKLFKNTSLSFFSVYF